MKKLYVTVDCIATYNSSIMVPDEMSVEEAIQYAKEHMNEIPRGTMEYVGDSGINEDSCLFEEKESTEFLAFIYDHLINKEEEYDAIIGDVEMPATLGFAKNWKITDYCMEKYGDLLRSECVIINDSTIEIKYDDYKKGRDFCVAVAGYVFPKEFNALFGTND